MTFPVHAQDPLHPRMTCCRIAVGLVRYSVPASDFDKLRTPPGPWCHNCRRELASREAVEA